MLLFTFFVLFKFLLRCSSSFFSLVQECPLVVGVHLPVQLRMKGVWICACYYVTQSMVRIDDEVTGFKITLLTELKH